MSSVAVLPAVQVVAPEGASIAPAIVALLTSGVVGMSIKNMFDSIISDDDESDDASDEMADGGGLMAEDEDDDFGDLGGLDGDGNDADGFGGDEFADMDESGGADVDELEHRLDELENEVGSLSSTASTVRTENEQISESVQEVEENVRKLLDIYEMVTRGVNPFADDIEAGMGSGSMGSDTSFGLFDNGGGTQDDGENIDDDIANADAEGFFDEELADEPGGGEPSEADRDVDDVFGTQGDDGGFEDDGGSFDEDFDDFDDGDGNGENGDDGKSFQELKDEYESGDTEWDEGETAETETAEDDGAEPDDNEQLEDLEDVEEDDDTGTEATTEVKHETVQAPETNGRPTEPEQPTQAETQSADTGTVGEGASDSDSTTAGRKPYLSTLPAGFAGDLIVVEWLEYLLRQAGHREAARAIDYYETIDWIDEAVADDLQEVLRGFDDVDGGAERLTIDHHTRSLQYISQLDDGGAEAVALSKLVGGGGSDGIQR